MFSSTCRGIQRMDSEKGLVSTAKPRCWALGEEINQRTKISPWVPFSGHTTSNHSSWKAVLNSTAQVSRQELQGIDNSLSKLQSQATHGQQLDNTGIYCTQQQLAQRALLASTPTACATLALEFLALIEICSKTWMRSFVPAGFTLDGEQLSKVVLLPVWSALTFSQSYCENTKCNFCRGCTS